MKLDRLSKKLAKGLEYYTTKPERRCSIGTSCYYDGSKKKGVRTKGCFVGQFLTPEDRKKADEFGDFNSGSASVDQIASGSPELLPKWVLDNVSLMRRFQALHDDSTNWVDEGLSVRGSILTLDIILQYNLNKKDFDNIFPKGCGVYPLNLFEGRDSLVEKLKEKYNVNLDINKTYATNKHLQLFEKISGSWMEVTIPKENLNDGGFHK